jgi:dihydrofolate reductase
MVTVGAIEVHELISLDGVNEAPSWTFGYGFDPKMGEDIGGIFGSCKAILLGRRTYEEFAPADGLVDDLHLFVYPVALGAGQRLFTDGVAAKFALAGSQAYRNGVLHLAYTLLGHE